MYIIVQLSMQSKGKRWANKKKINPLYCTVDHKGISDYWNLQ